MEHSLAASQEHLLGSLDFSLSPSASYVIQRTMTSFYPSGSSEFSPTGVQVARFNLTSQSFLDPESIRISFTINNTGSGPVLTFKGGPWTFFNRIRLMAGSTCLEDIFYANRINQMLNDCLQPRNHAENEWLEGTNISGGALDGVNHGVSFTVNFKPMCLGFLHCKKMFPAFASGTGLVLELYLAPTEECCSHENWKLTQAEVFCDELLLDSALENSYRKSLLEGRTLSMGYSTFNTIMQSIPAGTSSVAVPVVRAATRIRGLLISFGIGNNDPTKFYHPAYRHTYELNHDVGGPKLEDVSPTLIVSLGAKRFPIKPIASLAMYAEHLRKVLNIYSTSLGGFNIKGSEYWWNKFIIGVSMERVPGQQFSGVSSRQGDLIVCDFKNMWTEAQLPAGSAAADSLVDRCFVSVISDSIVEFSQAGVTVFD